MTGGRHGFGVGAVAVREAHSWRRRRPPPHTPPPPPPPPEPKSAVERPAKQVERPAKQQAPPEPKQAPAHATPLPPPTPAQRKLQKESAVLLRQPHYPVRALNEDGPTLLDEMHAYGQHAPLLAAAAARLATEQYCVLRLGRANCLTSSLTSTHLYSRQAAPAAEPEAEPEPKKDTVASRVAELYDKIRKALALILTILALPLSITHHSVRSHSALGAQHLVLSTWCSSWHPPSRSPRSRSPPSWSPSRSHLT